MISIDSLSNESHVRLARTWSRCDSHAPVRAIADEDIPRTNEEKTSAVHFLRFEFENPMIADSRPGANFIARIEHPACRAAQPLGEDQHRVLLADFD